MITRLIAWTSTMSSNNSFVPTPSFFGNSQCRLSELKADSRLLDSSASGMFAIDSSALCRSARILPSQSIREQE